MPGDIFKVFKICTKLIHTLVTPSTFTNDNRVRCPSHWAHSPQPWRAPSLARRCTTTCAPWRTTSGYLSWYSPVSMVQSRCLTPSLWPPHISCCACELKCHPPVGWTPGSLGRSLGRDPWQGYPSRPPRWCRLRAGGCYSVFLSGSYTRKTNNSLTTNRCQFTLWCGGRCPAQDYLGR